jgi:hypothetical protein
MYRFSGNQNQDAAPRSIIKDCLLFALVMMMLLPPSFALAQEIPRPCLTRRRSPQSVPPESNIKIGKVHFTVDAGLNTEYVDNIHLTSVDPVGDVIITPEIGIAAAWQATELNTFRFRTALGWTKYLDHPQLDRQNLTISPDSALSFRLYAGDFRIDVYDQFSLKNETSDEPSLAGVSSLPRFENTAGISVTWDLNDLTWSLGYARYDLTTLGDAVSGDGAQATDLSRLNHTTHQVSASVSLKFTSTLLAGLEATGANVVYPDDDSRNFTSFSFGPFVQLQLTRYTCVAVEAGVKGYSTEDGESVTLSRLVLEDDGSVGIEDFQVPGRAGGTEAGFYANISLTHRLNRHYSDRLDFGHEDQADAFSGRTETDYVRYSSNWALGERVSLSLNLFWERIRETSGSIVGTTAATDYRRLGGGITATYQMTDRANIGIAYQFIKQESDLLAASYEQNRFLLRLGYRF